MVDVCVFRGGVRVTDVKATEASPRFKDAAGREWFCRVDWSAIRRSAAGGVDLSMLESHLGDFYRGSILLVDALWAVLGPEADKQNIDRETFEAGMVGEAMVRGREALLAGCTDFFPSQRAKLMHAANAEIVAEIRGLLSLSQKQSTELPAKSA